MKLKLRIYIFFGVLILFGCNSSPEIESYVEDVIISKSTGVGPNKFIFILKINKESPQLFETLLNSKTNFFFSNPLEELSTSSIRCYKLSDNEVHINVISSLWADNSSEELSKKAKTLNNTSLKIKITNESGQSWEISKKK